MTLIPIWGYTGTADEITPDVEEEEVDDGSEEEIQETIFTFEAFEMVSFCQDLSLSPGHYENLRNFNRFDSFL